MKCATFPVGAVLTEHVSRATGERVFGLRWTASGICYSVAPCNYVAIRGKKHLYAVTVLGAGAPGFLCNDGAVGTSAPLELALSECDLLARDSTLATAIMAHYTAILAAT